MSTKRFMKVLSLAILMLALVGVQAVWADWTPPTDTPPACSAGNPACNPPINVGSALQTKVGELMLGGKLDVAGNVGIGTIAGTVPLQAIVEGSNSDVFKWQYGTDNTYGTLYAGTAGVGINSQNPSTGYGIAFAINSALKMILTDAGNVGIGISNPTNKLDVNGKIQAAGDICTSLGGGICLSTVTPVGGYWTASGNNIYNSNTGNVGIGVISPVNKLDVVGKIQATGDVCANGGSVCLSTAGGLPAGTSGQTLRHNGTAWVADSNLYNNGTNVGIGTSNPQAKLSLGSSLANTKLALYDAGNPNDLYGLGVQSAQLRFHVGNSGARFSFLNGPAGTELMTINGNGNASVGINTNNELDVVGLLNSNDLHSNALQLSYLDEGSSASPVNVIDLSVGSAAHETNAGKIGYEKFAPFNELDIVGAGTAVGNRMVKIWDNLLVRNDITGDRLCDGAGSCVDITNLMGGSSSWTENSTNNVVYPTTLTRNVAIGTASPADANTALTMEKSVVGGTKAVLRNTNTAGWSVLRLETGSGGTDGVGVITMNGSGVSGYGNAMAVTNTSASGPLLFVTGGSAAATYERMRITSAGNVGIGNTNPTNKLDVAGKIQATGGDVCTSLNGGVCLSTITPGLTYVEGPGIIINNNTISVDTTTIQARVSGTCPIGQAIRVVNANGTVTCQTAGGTTGVTQIIAGTGITISPTGGTGNVTITNSSTVPNHGLYGYCSEPHGLFGNGCSSAISPATCPAMSCSCSSTYTRVTTGVQGTVVSGGNYVFYYSCYKN